jgi:predicted transcriptional regulator
VAGDDHGAKQAGERRAFGELEGEVLAALWAAPGPLIPAEVQAAVGGDLAYTTVMTILVRLHDKGVIEREKVGRAYAYRPIVAEREVVADQVRRLLDRGHSRTAVLQGLVQGLEPADEQLLRDLLAKATAKRDETPGEDAS